MDTSTTDLTPSAPVPGRTVAPPKMLIVTAWIVMLLVSMLPNALLYELAGIQNAPWMPLAKISLLALLSAAAFLRTPVRPLRNYFLILLSIFVAEELVSRLTATSMWVSWFGGPGAAFTSSMLGNQLGRLVISLLVIVALLLMGYHRKDFFLVRGDIRAPIEPVRWLGFPKPDSWMRFGWQFAIYISLGLLVFLVIAGRPTLSTLLLAAPMFPAVLLFAVMNAFNEEMTYRASLLAGTENVLGPRHSLWITSTLFGLGHYFGVPYGVVGVLMAGFLGWLLGKAMLETRGFFWAWFIHFLQDVMIFTFMAIGSITPGG